MSEEVLAWHFVGSTLRDGRPVPEDGEKLFHSGPIELCRSGLHASERLCDALQYAPDLTLCRVSLSGKIIRGGDKLVASERTILWRVEAKDLVRKFARLCALDVIHLWDAPDIVVKYLKTGDESIRAAAGEAAQTAARTAWAAAGAAARTAWAAAWAAAGAAAWAAAEAAAWAAAAGEAAEAAAWAAAAGEAAAGEAAGAAAEAAARSAAGSAQKDRLEQLAFEEHRKQLENRNV